MTTSKNYLGAAGSDNEIAYIAGSTNVFRTDGIASVYWPGLRDNDSYSIQTRGGTGNNITLTTTNPSGLARIRYGWGEGIYNLNVYYRLVNRNSGKVLDVNGGAATNGASIIQWPSNNGNNQQWRIADISGGYNRIINRNSNIDLDVNAASTADGASIIQWGYNGGNNQQWQIISNGGGYYRIINRNSGKALAVTGSSTADGASIVQQTYTGANNQQWQVIQQ